MAPWAMYFAEASRGTQMLAHKTSAVPPIRPPNRYVYDRKTNDAATVEKNDKHQAAMIKGAATMTRWPCCDLRRNKNAQRRANGDAKKNENSSSGER